MWFLLAGRCAAHALAAGTSWLAPLEQERRHRPWPSLRLQPCLRHAFEDVLLERAAWLSALLPRSEHSRAHDPPQEMYDWGKRFGWDPVIWKDDQPHPAPQAPPVAAYAGGLAQSGAPPTGGHGPGPMQQQQQPHSQQQGYSQQGRGGHQQQQQRMMHHHGQHGHGGQRGMGRR